MEDHQMILIGSMAVQTVLALAIGLSSILKSRDRVIIREVSTSLSDNWFVKYTHKRGTAKKIIHIPNHYTPKPGKDGKYVASHSRDFICGLKKSIQVFTDHEDPEIEMLFRVEDTKEKHDLRYYSGRELNDISNNTKFEFEDKAKEDVANSKLYVVRK